MEGVAWLLHRYVMHGFGWYVHEDHHRYTTGRFEKKKTTSSTSRSACSPFSSS